MPQITPLALSTPKPSAPGWAYVLESALPPDPSRTPLVSLASNAAQGKKRTDGPAGPAGRAAAKNAMESMLGGMSKMRATRQRQRLEDLTVEIGHRGLLRQGGGSGGLATSGGEGSAGLGAGGGIGGGAGSSHHNAASGGAGGGGGGAGHITGSGTGGIDLPARVRTAIADARWKITKGAGKAVGGGPQGQIKPTQNVRRILASTKTWTHHAADEEAARLNQLHHHHPSSAAARANREKLAKRRKDGEDVAMLDPSTAVNTYEEEEGDKDDLSALLHTSTPTFPSEDVLATLTRGPPLSYSLARAQPDPNSAASHIPPRKFCAMCGYWGTVKCTFCGANVCGLSCKATHDMTEHPHTTR